MPTADIQHIDPSAGRADGPQWYAVSTQPRREMIAVAHLERQNFETFIPRRRVTTSHARRTQVQIRSFFPGYIFVRLDIARQRWRPINSTQGVRSLVMQGEAPLRAPPGMVDTLKAMTDDEGWFVPQPSFEKGERVRLLSGPFGELVGRVEKMTAEHRVRVLLDLMNGHIPVVVDRSELARAV